MAITHSTPSSTTAVSWRSTAMLKQVAKDLFNKIRNDQVPHLAAAFAYNTVFAIPALIILTITMAAVVDQATSVHVAERLRDTIQDRAPADTKELLTSLVDNAVARVGGGKASLGLVTAAVLALWSGSNAIGALMNAFNLAYDVQDKRPFGRRKLLSFGLTLLLAVVINAAFVLLVFGRRIGEWIAGQVGLGSTFDTVWAIARWPIAIVSIALLLAVLYYVGPDVEQSFRWISPGSAAATLAWLLATGLFGLYLHISNPGSAYGALGSVLVLLFFLYITGLIFIVGAELNALLASRYDERTIKDLAQHDGATPETKQHARQRLGWLRRQF
jgi:membrane protein